MKRLDYLFKQYENILGWYKHSETKSNFLVSVNTLMVGVINGLLFVGVDKMAQVNETYTGSLWCLLALCGLSLVGSYLYILKAIWARHHGKTVTLDDNEKLWFFGHAASMTKEQHKRLVDNWSEPAMEETMVTQNYILSCNVNQKYDALNRAISLTIISLILLFILGITYAAAITS